MVASRTLCDRSRLQQLLDETLTQHEQATVEHHLEACRHCRHDLELLAAGSEVWTEAASHLASVATDEVRVRQDHAETWAAETQWWPKPRFPLGVLGPSNDPTVLGTLDNYDVLEVVGQGGMGIVAKAHDRELNRLVAIKILAPHLASSAAARQRFAREAQAAAAVVHPHVVPIHAVNASAPLPYLVMQYVGGDSLQQRIDRAGPLPIRDILRIGLQTAKGLAAAHEQGMVHRDIKPSNILMENGMERVLISDFGLARAADDASLTRSGVIAGTPQYMSPEQARGMAIDYRTDLFSLGCVLYTMATGHPPFRAESSMAVLHRICTEAPRPVRQSNPDVPEWFETLVQRCLEKTPSDRFGSAEDLATTLAACLAHLEQPLTHGLPESVRPASPRETPRQPQTILRWVAALSIFVLVVATAAVALRNQGSEYPAKPPSSTTTAQESGSSSGADAFVGSDDQDSAVVSVGSASVSDGLSSPDGSRQDGLGWDDSLDDELSLIQLSLTGLEQSLDDSSAASSGGSQPIEPQPDSVPAEPAATAPPGALD